VKKILVGIALALAIESSLASAPTRISGHVEILDKGDVKRKVVQNAIVYIDGVQATVPPALLSEKYKIASQNKSFTPHVQAVPVGAKVTFPNLDDIMHNVFSISRGNRFDLGLYKSGASKTNQFKNPGLVRIYCNIHPQMSAFVMVLENPYFAWVQPDGSFRIDHVPSGNYTLKAWHEQAKAETQVRVGAGGADNVQMVLDARRFKKRPHKNKFGKPYKKKRVKY
jgi:plastocyanin